MDRKHPERLVVSEVNFPRSDNIQPGEKYKKQKAEPQGVGLGACTLNGVRWHMLQGLLSWPGPPARFFAPRPIFISGESIE